LVLLAAMSFAGALSGCGSVDVVHSAAVAPTIGIEPQSVTVLDGRPASFTVGADGTEPLSYQWSRNGVPIYNATSTTYAIPAVQYGETGSVYTVAVTNVMGRVLSKSATLTVTPVKPSILTQPSSQTVAAGAAATFRVVATGTTPLTYQWSKNGTAIAGATNPTYIYQGTQLADNGAQFSVTITNVVGTVTSSTATLTVQSFAPSIVTQPQQQTVLAGATATFTVIVNGSPPLSFRWRKNGVVIAGATSASYVTPPTTLSDSGALFDVVVINPVGSVTSATAALTVESGAIAPMITMPPQNLSAAVGGSATFTVSASGTQPLSYQWSVNGTSIPGATNSSLTLSPVTSQENDASYSVVVSNTAGSATSQGATLTVTASGRIDLIAGQLGGSGNLNAAATASRFFHPDGLTLDPAGDIFVTDTYNSTIREIVASGVVIQVAGDSDLVGSANGVGPNAQFNYPGAIAFDPFGNIYVLDGLNQVIRKISSTGVVSTFAGTLGVTGSADGAGTAAQFNYPRGIATDANGNLYVADTANCTIREITPAGIVSTIAGIVLTLGATDGPAATATFYGPYALTVDASGTIYIADTFNATIRKIAAGVVSTLAGTAQNFGWADGAGAAAQFDHPQGIALDLNGNLFVTDSYSDTIRMVTNTGQVSTVAGMAYTPGSVDGTGAAASFQEPWGIAADAGNNLFVMDSSNHTVRRITPTGVVTTYAGDAPHPGSADGTGSAAQFNAPQAATADAAGNIFVADTANNTIRLITPAGVVSTLAGTPGATGSSDGTGSAAQFNGPSAIAVDSSDTVYVADTGNNTIRMITPAGVVTTLAGTAGVAGSIDGTGTAAQFNAPQGLALDASNNLYVADTGNSTIRIITPAAVVTTVAGTAGAVGGMDNVGGLAQFNAPQGLTINSTGIYIADTGNSTIRIMTPTGVVTTLAGVAGQAAYADGIGTDARFNGPTAVALDANGNLYVMDSYYRVIREVSPGAVVTTAAGVAGWHGVALGPLPGSFNNPVGIAVLPGSPTSFVVPDMGENVILRVTIQ
jgi:sugar lactone lactonase YvrE